MNDAFRQAAEVDPEWARSEQRKVWTLKIVTAGALLAIAIGTIALILGVHNSTEITEIQHSACAVNPSSRECQTIKRESDQEQSVADACISFHKVGYACPKPGSKAAVREVREQDAFQHPKGVTPQTPSTAHQHPSPPSGGHPGETHQPTSTKPPAATAEPEPAPAAVSPGPRIEEPQTSQPQTPPPVTESASKAPVREIVGAATEGDVSGVLGGATNVPCLLTKSC